VRDTACENAKRLELACVEKLVLELCGAGDLIAKRRVRLYELAGALRNALLKLVIDALDFSFSMRNAAVLWAIWSSRWRLCFSTLQTPTFTRPRTSTIVDARLTLTNQPVLQNGGRIVKL